MKKILSLVLFCAFLVRILPFPANAEPDVSTPGVPTPGVSAESFCLLDADTLEVLYCHAENKSLPMASTTKILTCLLALEEWDLSQKVRVPGEAVGAEGSSMYLFEGEELTALDLLHGLMLESANDAAEAIAILISGSKEAFAERMNQKAREIGMSASHFVNPSGLPAEGHVSTANDMARLLAAAMQNEAFCRITSQKSVRIEFSPGKYQTLTNHNRLLRSYPYCVGGKTGFTVSAGRCLVTAAKKDGKTLVVSTLNDPSDWADHKALFEYGFSLYETKTLEAGFLSLNVPVVGGEGKSACFANEKAWIFPARIGKEISFSCLAPPFLYAPVAEKQKIEALVLQDGAVIARGWLFCRSGVSYSHTPTFWERFWTAFLRMI